ncbi:MAG TPA: hypothetical protein VMV03_17790 [Spirochaetia bacterium]|nr:hypothetical protein [Spirochaetia bacterium]
MKSTPAKRGNQQKAAVVRRARLPQLPAPGDAPRAWIVTADMGLGHQRGAWPLRGVANEGIMTLGKAGNTPPAEHKLWERLRRSYEFLSRTKSWPIIGNTVFGALDRLQNIPRFYPVRDMSNPSFQVWWLKRLIQNGMCGSMLKTIRENPLPLVTTFYAPAIAADMAGYTPTYCVICDAEINRAWVGENPRASKIVYLAPCGRAVRRLNEYGIPNERIWLTGFPLPTECLGNRTLNVLRKDLGQRLHYLDPLKRFWPLHSRNVEYFLGRENCKPLKQRVLTVTFGVGGAGAQVDIAHTIARSLREKIVRGEVRLNILAGVRAEVRQRLETIRKELAVPQVRIIAGTSLEEYFKGFAECMRTTDILWTKPSELSFYCGLGIPIIMAPNIGSQEEYNQAWLLEIQAGFPQQDPQYTDQWLLDLVKAGRLADAAWNGGFLKARKFGTYKIHEIIRTGTMKMESSVLCR